jgi:hypothetical protein
LSSFGFKQRIKCGVVASTSRDSSAKEARNRAATVVISSRVDARFRAGVFSGDGATDASKPRSAESTR